MADGPALVFEVACAAGFVAMTGVFGYRSLRDRRVAPGLWLTLACLSIFWLEGPYDWSMYAEFRPGIGRFPEAGPLGATYQGLPWLAAPGYVLYFGVPTVIAIALAPRVTGRFALTRPIGLLVAGLAVGTCWDAVWEIVGTRVGLWRFARTDPGLVLWSGSRYQVPVYCFLAMGATIMVCTYLAGRIFDNGRTVVATVAGRVTSGRAATVATGLGFVLAVHAVYLLTMAPHAITKVAGWQTTTSSLDLYSGIPLQPR
jgi:hypothetical protein